MESNTDTASKLCKLELTWELPWPLMDRGSALKCRAINLIFTACIVHLALSYHTRTTKNVKHTDSGLQGTTYEHIPFTSL